MYFTNNVMNLYKASFHSKYRGLSAEEMKTMSDCPICGCDIINETAELCELIPCPDCGSDLEVISIDPMALEAAPEEQEDWGE